MICLKSKERQIERESFSIHLFTTQITFPSCGWTRLGPHRELRMQRQELGQIQAASYYSCLPWYVLAGSWNPEPSWH